MIFNSTTYAKKSFLINYFRQKSLSASQSCVLGRKMRARAHLKGEHVTDGDAHRVVRRSNRAGLVLDAPVSKQDVNANANATVNVNGTVGFTSPVEDEERVHRLQQSEAREQPMRCEVIGSGLAARLCMRE